jgi:hypothetical protein
VTITAMAITKLIALTSRSSRHIRRDTADFSEDGIKRISSYNGIVHADLYACMTPSHPLRTLRAVLRRVCEPMVESIV